MPRTPRLLPGELRVDADARRSLRDWAVDGVMYLVAFGISAVVLAETWDEHRAPLRLTDLVLGAAAFVLLWWRRPRPDVVGIVTGAMSIVSAVACGPALIAAFNVALRGSRRGILAVVGVSVVAIVVFPLIYPPPDPYVLQIIVGTLLIAVAIGWGLLARARREQLLALRDRARHVEAEQRMREAAARDAERRRIAREMHDVLAHRVSLLSLHAGALEYRRDASPEEVAQAAGVIRATAHAALQDLREVIGVLREGGDPDGAPERPQPTLADIPALVGESRDAGMRVSAQIDVPGDRPVPAALGRTAYRVVQEGLTNARKHAPDAAVEVRVTGGDPLVVEVVSRAPAGVAAGPAPVPGAGSGLIGLRERVALADGTLEHGPDAGGAFVLRATLPRAS